MAKIKNQLNNYPDSRVLRTLSNILSPFILNIFVFGAISLKVCSTLREAALIFGVSFFFQSLFPVLYLFGALKKGVIQDIHLFRKRDRRLVFPVLVINYLCAYLVLYFLNAPLLIIGLTLITAVLTLLIWLINGFYKISVHVVGIAAILTGIFFAFGPSSYFLEILLPIVCWVRFRTGAHILSQMITGAILGHGLTYLLLKLILV